MLKGLDALLGARAASGAVLAFSGGFDSSFLAWRLETLGLPFAPVRFDVPLLDVPAVRENRPDRCYWCKRTMCAHLWEKARALGYPVVMDGTNADDLKADRPGLKALREAGVFSPLAAAGLGKAALRACARQHRLPFADLAASPCLATRFPFDTPLDREALRRVEQAEDFLRTRLPAGTDIRVRVEGKAARIEVSRAARAAAEAQGASIVRHLARLGYCAVTLDPRGYRPAGEEK